MPDREIKPRAIASSIMVWCSHDELVDTTELIPNPRNPNKHPDKQVALLAKIIRAQGWRQPITVSNRSGFVVKGHGRLQAAQLLGVELVPVERQSYESEAAEYADLIADNRIAELAEADEGMIADLLADDMFADFDMDLTGFDSADDCIKRPDGEAAGASPWDRVGDASEGIMFSFGEVQARMQKELYEAFLSSIEKKTIEGWISEAVNH